MSVLVREYHDDDLEGVVHLWDATEPLGQGSVFTVAEGIASLRANEPAVVALSAGRVVGMALAAVSGERAWVMRLAVDPGRRGEGLVSSLLRELERLLVEQHVRRIGYVLPEEELLSEGLVKAGYQRLPAVAYFEKLEAVGPGEAAVLSGLGGRMLPSDLWPRVAGMRREKELIERRVILPLAEPERAQAHGVVPPRAIVLFGPPGTGKTTFARGIASRLGWPFVEIFPSRLASEEGGLSAALRDVFHQISDLERVLVFMDEVEEVASLRDGVPTSPAHGVTNELLKLIPSFRERDTRLLVAATNSVRSLDSAFLRPGRFDYVIPVGPPDAEARRALWGAYTRGPGRAVEVEALVEASSGLTPADIEHVAQVAAQSSFERDVVEGRSDAAPGASTGDYLTALGTVRPTVSDAMVQEFTEDIEAFARV
ncbi:MAG: GNAT family N-acetyltransferase [Actinomycetes bacterium]